MANKFQKEISVDPVTLEEMIASNYSLNDYPEIERIPKNLFNMLSPFTRDLLDLRAQGLYQTQIAMLLDMTQPAVCEHLKRAKASLWALSRLESPPKDFWVAVVASRRITPERAVIVKDWVESLDTQQKVADRHKIDQPRVNVAILKVESICRELQGNYLKFWRQHFPYQLKSDPGHNLRYVKSNQCMHGCDRAHRKVNPANYVGDKNQRMVGTYNVKKC